MMLVWNNWSKHVKWLSVPQQNLSDIPQFSKLCVLQIINTIVSIWCGNILRYYFVLGHYLFLKVHSLLLGTDNVCGQISEQVSTPKKILYCLYISGPNRGYCLFISIKFFSWRIMWLLLLSCAHALVLNKRRIINTNSRHLVWKYTQIFVFGYYLFL